MRQNLVSPGEAGRAIVARNVRVQSNVGILASATMKTILIPTEDHDAMPAVLEAARIVAKTFDSYMEGFAVHPAAATYVAAEPVARARLGGFARARRRGANALGRLRGGFGGAPRGGPFCGGGAGVEPRHLGRL